MNDAGYVTARQYVRALRRRWWVIVLALILGGWGGLAYGGSVAKQYRSVVTVSVTPTGIQDVNAVTGVRTATVVNMDNEVQLVTSPAVGTGASALLRSGADPFSLVKKVSVTVRPNTALMDIAFKAAEPAEAQQGAHAFAIAYLNQRTLRAQGDLDDQISGLQSQIKAVSAQLRTVTGQIASLPDNSPTRAYAGAQQTVLVSQLSSLQAKLAPLQTTVITPGEILSDARLPTTPTGLGKKILLLGGLLVGLLVGLVLASVAESLDPRVLHADDLTDSRLPVLARFGRSGLRAGRLAPTGSRTALTFAHLRNRLVAAVARDEGMTVVVTGAKDGAGAGVVAANLAVALARGGFDTVLVCLDGDTRALSAFDPAGSMSVNALMATDEPSEWPAVLPSLRVLAGSDATGGPLPTAALPSLNKRLRTLAPYVIVEAPSIGKDADTHAWAAIADAVLVVVEMGRTTTGSVRRATALLEPLSPTVAGAVTLPRVRRAGPPALTDADRASADDRFGPEAEPAPAPRPSSDDDAVARLHGAK